jgi:hypothetical protein
LLRDGRLSDLSARNHRRHYSAEDEVQNNSMTIVSIHDRACVEIASCFHFLLPQAQ